MKLFQASPMYSPMDGSTGAHFPPIQGHPMQGSQPVQVHPLQGIPGPAQGGCQPVQGIQGVHVSTDTVELKQPPPGKTINDNFHTNENAQGQD